MFDLDLRGGKAIYEQIIEQIKYHVMKGHLQPQDSIPSVRKLAMELNITPGTVARAYQELEREHIIETVRGKGTFIAKKPESRLDEEKLEGIKKQLAAKILEMKMMGMENEQIQEIIAELCEEF